MCIGDSKKNDVTLTTQAKDYSSSKEKFDDTPPLLVQQSPSTSSPNGPLHLEQPSLDIVLLPPPKGVVQKYCRRFGARTFYDVISQSPEKFSHSMKHTVKRY
jgi:hypothetical protein